MPDGDHRAVEIVPFKTLSLLEAFRPVWWNIGDRGLLLRPHEHPRIETASVKERHSQGYASTEMQEQAQVEEGVVCSGGSSADCKTAVKDQEPDHLYGLSDADVEEEDEEEEDDSENEEEVDEDDEGALGDDIESTAAAVGKNAPTIVKQFLSQEVVNGRALLAAAKEDDVETITKLFEPQSETAEPTKGKMMVKKRLRSQRMKLRKKMRGRRRLRGLSLIHI